MDNTVVIEVRQVAEIIKGAVRAMESGQPEPHPRISFQTPEMLWKTLTPKRWELLRMMCGAGPMSIREAARRLGRDVKAVHGDVTSLLNAGVLWHAESGGIEFPFEAIRVEFTVTPAAA